MDNGDLTVFYDEANSSLYWKRDQRRAGAPAVEAHDDSAVRRLGRTRRSVAKVSGLLAPLCFLLRCFAGNYFCRTCCGGASVCLNLESR